MRRLIFICLLLFIGTLPVTVNVLLPEVSRTVVSAAGGAQDPNSARSAPLDSNVYVRGKIPQDFIGALSLPLATPTFVRDVVVSNSDATLTTTDMFNDGETTIAVNPANANEIVITAFSGGWGANAPIWHSTDGGNNWTKRFTVPVPPGAGGTSGCPCDQAVDYGRSNRLSGTFLSFVPTDVYSGTTSNPTSSAAWNWFVTMGVTQRTNSVGVANVDQPWLLVNRDTANAAQDNVYVAYDNFAVFPIGMRVAVAPGSNPPNFTIDNSAGTSTNCNASICINPGHRLATDPRNGWVYSLFQQLGATDASLNFSSIGHTLNRSTDGGATWGLNASATGVVVATADSTQPTPKFGTVNALLGGVHHAAVDPSNGDVYVVYGNRDSGTTNNRLSIVRLTDNGSGGLTIGTSHFVTGQVQAALPSVAVATNGTVGVLYTTYDGMSGGFPQFTAHFANSTDQGSTFTDTTLLTFLSSATDNSNSRQRVLGDYNQVKAFGTTFYGVFTGNGVPLGRPFANHDPIFFKAFAGCNGITCPTNITKSNDPNQCSAVVTYPDPTSSGDCGTISCSPASGGVFQVGTTTVNCTSQAGATCSFTITVNDTQPPQIGSCPANITAVTNQALCVPASQACQVVTFATPTASDNCPGVTVACNPPSGACMPVGTTTVTCTARDASMNTATCSFTIKVFDVCLQDDGNPATVLLFNSATGEYRLCCGGTIFTGTGTAAVKGCTITLQHNPGDRRLQASVDKTQFKGSAILQFPPGVMKCTIIDRDIRNNGCVCP